MVNLATLFQPRLNLFWADTPGCVMAEVRDIYRREFEVFQSLGWVLFYLASVVIFKTHMCLEWQKVGSEEADAQSEYEKVSQENEVTRTTKEQGVKYKTQGS